ncbi:MAG: hypothetical protein LAQ30_05400 [Acidobacteriia bacterium]|nr:hypothetical protein [Terriglobia bacterium]
MRQGFALSIIAIAGLLDAQNGQSGAKPGWPCVPGRPVDPAYLDISESTGGQLFLFQKNEVAQSALVMNASHTHPVTVLRAIGNLNGTRDFEFPVDPGMASFLLLASLQCRNAILVYRPGGQELTGSNTALSVDLHAGRMLRIDQPEAGPWRVRLAGRGLFVLSVLARADTALTGVAFSVNRDAVNGEDVTWMKSPLFGVRQDVEVRLTGQVSDLKLQLVDTTGDRVSDIAALARAGEGLYLTSLTPQAQRFRVLVTGAGPSAWRFERMHPVLFQAQPRK